LDACFVVTDSAGQKLAYVYFEDESKDEARRITANVAKFPGFAPALTPH
jgi:hypothetical protein